MYLFFIVISEIINKIIDAKSSLIGATKSTLTFFIVNKKSLQNPENPQKHAPKIVHINPFVLLFIFYIIHLLI